MINIRIKNRPGIAYKRFSSLYWVILSIIITPILARSQTPSQTDKVFSLSAQQIGQCGLITRQAPNQLPYLSPGCLQEVDNILYDSDGSIKRRNGEAQYNLTAINNPNTGPVKGLWPFYATDGTRYLIAFSSGAMWSSSGNGSFTVIPGLSGLSTTAEMECVQAMGQLWCADGTDPVFETNVTSTASVPTAPLGTLIGTFRNRIIIAGVYGNLTQIYGSGYLNGQDWGLNLYPNISTSSFIIDVSGANDGQKITCLLGEYQNQFLIGRNYDLYGLSGYSNNDFTLRKVSDQVGCIEPKSVQEVNNVLIWLSKRGVEGYTGTQITPISYYITPTINQIIAAAGNSQSKTLTTQADWQSGNLTASGAGAPMSATISVGDVVPGTWTVTDLFSSYGSSVNISTYIAPGELILNYSSFSMVNGGFLSGDFTNWTNSGFSLNPTANISDKCNSGNSAFAYPPVTGNATITTTLSLMNGSTDLRDCIVTDTCSNNSTQTGGCQYQCLPNSSTCDINGAKYTSNGRKYYGFILSSSELSNQKLAIKITDSASGDTLITQSTYSALNMFVGIGSANKGGGSPDPCGSPSPQTDEIAVNTCASQEYYSSGTFLSQSFDTTFSTPIFGNFITNISSGSSDNLSLSIQSSSNNVNWNSLVSQTANSVIGSTVAQYIRYQAVLTNSNSNNTPTLSNPILSASTTGYYITPAILVSSPTSWGQLNVDGINNGGSFTFWESTGATAAQATSPGANWISQSANANIVVTTNTAYTATRVLFTLASATDTPTLNDITYNWNIGSARPPVSSAEYQDRYYLFYTTSTATGSKNDHVAVYDYNNKWTLFDDINAYSSTLYLNNLYTGDSGATGLVFNQDSGQSDNGNPYSYSFQTGDLDMGDPMDLKTFERMYISLSAPPNNASYPIQCNYQIDGASTTYSLNIANLNTAPSGTGYWIAKFPFPISPGPTQGYWLNISCNESGTNGPISIYGMDIVWTPAGWQ